MKAVIKCVLTAVLFSGGFCFAHLSKPVKLANNSETYDLPIYCPACDSWHIAGCCPKGNR